MTDGPDPEKEKTIYGTFIYIRAKLSAVATVHQLHQHLSSRHHGPFYWVLLGFYLVLLGFTGFYLVLLAFNGFYWVLLSFTGFYWVLLGSFT